LSLIFIDIFCFEFIEREPGKMKINMMKYKIVVGRMTYCRLTDGVADARMKLSITGSRIERS